MPSRPKNDASVNDADAATLHSAGVDVDGVGAPAEEVVVDIAGAAVSDEDAKNVGIRFVEPSPTAAPSVDHSDLSRLAEEKSRGKDLEAEFRSSLSDAAAPAKKSSAGLAEKEGVMTSLLSKIREKLGLKKAKVREELASLKKMKDGIAEDIADIKELEESEEKIAEKMKKLDTIKGELEAIEDEVEKELQS